MKITFTATTEEAWRHPWRTWVRFRLRLTLQLTALPLVALCFCYFGGMGAPFTIIAVLVTGSVPAACFLLMLKDLFRKIFAFKSEATGTMLAEIGRFDFRLGLTAQNGYYYHWSYFDDIVADDHCLYFVLKGHQALRVPTAAFAGPSECRLFLEEAHASWKNAQQRQLQIIIPEDMSVWPPPLRIGV